MNRLKASNSVAFASRDIAPVSGTPQYATDGVPGTTPATVWPAYMFNMIQDELLSILLAGGLTADDTNWSQVWQALFKAFSFNDGGAADTMTVALPAGVSFPSASLGAGTAVKIKANATNLTPTPTLALFGLTAKTIIHGDASALIPGDIQSGLYHEFIYDGTNWRLVWRALGASSGRLRLTSNINLYVNASTGNDSNNGQTSGTPWLTLQKAWNFIVNNLDLNGFTVTVNCTGAFTTGVIATGAVVGGTGYASVVFSFTAGASVTATNASCFIAANFATFTVQAAGASLTLTASGTGANQGYGILAIGGGFINIGANLILGSCAVADIGAYGSGSNVTYSASFTTTGTSGALIQAQFQGVVAPNGGVTITASGTPAYTVATVLAQFGATVNVATTTFSGAATGTRYNAGSNGVINTSGGGANFIFGNAAGTVNLVGGVYGNGSGQYL